MILIWLLMIVPLVFVLYNEYRCFKIRQILKHTECLPTLPLVGNAHQVGKTPKDIINFKFRLIHEFNHRNCAVWIGWNCNYMIFETKDVEFVLSSTELIAKSDSYDLLEPWFGEGLLTSKGAKWRKHRKMITPSFHFKILQDFHETMNTISAQFVETLRKVSEGDRIFDFQNMAGNFTLNVICDTAMGVNLNAMDDNNSAFVKNLAYLCENMNMRMIHPLKRKMITYQFFPEYKKFCKALKLVRDFTFNVIEKRKEQRNLEGTHTKSNTADKKYGKQKLAFLDNLLSSTIDGRPLTLQEIYEEVSTFIFEGHDTTTSALGFTVFLLSRHLRVQRKVLEEQKQIMGENFKRNATYQELNEMKYLDLVIKETLRLYSSVPAIGRYTDKEYNMNGKIIPKDTSIILIISAYGYNENVFPDPYIFKPERFENVGLNETQNPFEYVPFSAGPRNCIGQRFALLELKTVISKIVRNFEILPALDELESKDGYVSTIYGPLREKRPKPHPIYDPVLAMLMTLKSDNGLHIRLRERM